MANITWRDGVTTVAIAGIVALERAHFHNWDLPLIADVRWALAAFVVLGVMGFASGYLSDEEPSAGWTYLAGSLALIGAVIAGFGFYTANSDYLVLFMIDSVVFLLVSLLRHVTMSESAGHAHA